MSWGVRRIEDETTDPAYSGGGRSAMTVGEWLDSVASNPNRQAAPFTSAERSVQPSPNSVEVLDRKLAELNRRLKRLSENANGGSRDRRPEREAPQASRRFGRDRSYDDRDTGRAPEPDPLSVRLDQIDRRLAQMSKPSLEPEADSYRGDVYRPEKQAGSDVERLRQGLREIERLQGTLLEGLVVRGKSGQAIDRSVQEDRERTSRQASAVAETIARLELEVRGLRQSVENRPEPTKPAFDDHDLQDMRRMLERMAEVTNDRQDSVQIERLFDEMNRLRDLVIETGTKAVGITSAKSAQEMRLADMVERLASVATSAQEKTTDDMRALDRRLAEVADRMAELEGRGATTKDITELQRAISGITAKLDRPVVAPKPVIPAGLLDLDIRIEKLSEKLDRLEPNPMASRQSAALETEIAALRLDLAQSTSSRTTAKIEERIGTLSDRIDRLAKAAESSDTSKLESEIGALGEQINRLASRPQAAAPQAVNLEKFEIRIGELVDVIDRMAGSGSALDKHVDALQGEVSSLRRDLAGLAATNRNQALEEQMRLLASRLERAGHESADPRILANIDEKIGYLTDLLNREERKSTDTTAIETKLDKLESLLADRHEDALEAASSAAREAVREFASFAADARQSDAGIRAFEDDLRQVQDAARSTESRTSDALQSVHDALTAIVSRLGAIERAPLERAPAERGYGDQLPLNRPAAPQKPAEAMLSTPRMAAASDYEPTLPPAPQARAPEPQAIAEDHRPLEPGSGKPRAAPIAAPMMPTGGPTPVRPPMPMAAPQMPRPDAPQAQAPQAPAPEGDAAGPKRNDFIAAARRAALAASQAGPGAPPPVPGERMAPEVQADEEDETGEKKSLLGSLFKGKQKTLVLAGVGIAAAGTMLAFATSSIMRVASIDTMPTASISAPVTPLKSAAPIEPASTPDINAASIALSPPSSVTSTFSQAPLTPEASRQAALADALKQAAIAQGIKTRTLGQNQPTSVVPAQSAAAQPMPQPVTTALADSATADATTTQSVGNATAQTPSTAPFALATDKIGSIALRTAAAGGDPKAQFEIGMRFSEGRGIAPDMHEATVWFERAASKNFLPAAYRLGSAYEKGLGVDRDPVVAKRWYRLAAEGGNIRAMHNLGVLYANERDMPSALPWFQKAADGGLKDSEFNLGIIYALGSGVKQDLGVSYKWFALGASQGDQEATKKRDDIATHLDHTALAAAKLAVSTWKPNPISRDANEESAVWSEPSATASLQSMPNGSSKIMQAQAALQGKGLYAGKIDGDLSPETRAAIKVFQKKSGLKQTGEIDPAFLSAIVAKPM